MLNEVLQPVKHLITWEDAMVDRKGSPIAILVMAVAGWLGAAISIYRIYIQSRKPEGDLFDAILNTVIFAVIAVFATIRYRKTKQGL